VQRFRRHQRLFLIALAAFLAQTFLALAHVHASAAYQRHLVQSAGRCSVGKVQSCTAPSPIGDDADCPLCGAIHVACALIASEAPAVILCISFADMQPTVPVPAARPSPRSLRFQARAPPAHAV
jgi:hypothetical protein